MLPLMPPEGTSALVGRLLLCSLAGRRSALGPHFGAEASADRNIDKAPFFSLDCVRPRLPVVAIEKSVSGQGTHLLGHFLRCFRAYYSVTRKRFAGNARIFFFDLPE